MYSYVAKVEPTIADQDDYDMLVRRNAGGPERASGISVEVANTVTAVSFACSSDDIATWCQRLESALLAPLRSRKQEGISAALSLSLDSRSPDDYRREVASYLAKMAPLVPSLARAMAVEDSAPNMQLLVINETEHNFTGVRVELAIEGDVWAFRSVEDALPDLPKRPRKWGSKSIGAFHAHFPGNSNTKPLRAGHRQLWLDKH